MKKLVTICLLLFLIQAPLLALAEEDDDLEIFGLEVEKLIYLATGLLAVVLCGLTYAGYSRSKRKNLLFIALAFLLYAIRAFMISSELFIDEIDLVDPIAAFLDFAILLSFFYGVIKR